MPNEQKRRLAVIMFSDIVGYTAMMQKNEADTLIKVERYKTAHKKKTQQYEGKILKFLGDGCLTIFESVVSAVECALEIQKELLKSPKVPVRIGIHIGEVVFADDDVYGDGINIASRIQSLGKEGTILFSRDVYDKIRNHPELRAIHLGLHSLKNVTLSLDVYALGNIGLKVPNPQDLQNILISETHVKDKKNALISQRLKIVFLSVLVVIVFAVSIYSLVQREIKKNIQTNLLPELEKDVSKIGSEVEASANWDVYLRAKDIKSKLKKNNEFNDLWERITIPLTVITSPKGAAFYAKPYAKPDTSWLYFGETPIYNIDFPRGLSRVKLKLQDFVEQEDIYGFSYFNKYLNDTINYQLYAKEDIPEGMVYVPSESYREFFGNIQTSNILIGEYFIDKHEVTNYQYKTFVNAKGYENQQYWDFPIIKQGDTLSWEAAIALFVDKTGWAGPSNWELSDYLKGQDDFPVSGVSWYEAAAFAKFMNKNLPTIYHWTNLAYIKATSEIIKYGNYRSNKLKEVQQSDDLTRYGTYNFAGNVSEWLYNASEDKKYIQGGNFKEPEYFYNYPMAIDPWERSEMTGFRCIKYLSDTNLVELTKPHKLRIRDFDNVEIVSDEIFDVYLDRYSYNKTDLNPRLISETDYESHIRKIIELDVPYEDTPLLIYIYLPKMVKPPYQSVIYFPHIGALIQDDTSAIELDSFYDYHIKSGRVLIWPVYYGTYGRGKFFDPQNAHEWIQCRTYSMIDMQLTCDYLYENGEFINDKIAYYGVSWGGYMAPFALAIEKRIKVGICCTFGVQSSESYPEYDQVNYLPRIKRPMLLMDGIYDQDFTIDQQQAFYDLLGTPVEHKKWCKYKSTHWIPRNDLINESLSWLNKYFGPVEKVESIK